MEEFPKKRDLTGQEIQDAQEGLLRWHIEEQGKRIREQEEQIEHDFLTKLKTRHVLENELEKSLQFIRGEIPEQRGEALSELSLIAMDIDHFKNVNDTFGHLTGSKTLEEIGASIINCLRSGDAAARFGGEEFAAFLLDAEIGQAMVAAERIRKEIEEREFSILRQGNTDGSHHVTISVGIASFPDDSSDPIQLVEMADSALYRAKREGRNRVCIYGAVDAGEIDSQLKPRRE